MPFAPNPGLEPCREIAHPVGWQSPEIAQVTGAVSRRNIHTTAEGDRKMRVVAADAGSFVENLQRGARGAGILIVECNAVMNVIADRLHARIPRSHTTEELPGSLRQYVGLTIAAAPQEYENLLGQVLHGVLADPGRHFIGLAGVVYDAIRRQAYATRGRNPTVALVSECVTIAGEKKEWVGDKTIGNNNVRGT